jgi:hypothetical protein
MTAHVVVANRTVCDDRVDKQAKFHSLCGYHLVLRKSQGESHEGWAPRV